MDFLRAEVEGEERISLARSGFGFSMENKVKCYKKKEIEEDIPTATDNSTEVEGLFHELEDRARSIFTLDERIKDLMIDAATDEELLVEYENCRDYKKKLEQYRTKVENFKKKEQVVTPDQTQGCCSGIVNPDRDSISYKFPKIEPKKFGGDPKDWLQFWGQFKKIDENQKIRNEDKFQFLVQSMVEGSKAKEIVESFPHSAENYPKAIRHLKSRFGNEDTLVEVYVRELLRLVLNTALNSKQSSLYDKLETQLRALESLGVTSEKYASILFPLVESSLPEDVLRAWERHRNSTLFFGQDGNRLSQIMDFLRAEVEGEERISLARSGFGFSMENKVKCYKKKEIEEDIPTATGLFSANQNSEKKYDPCIFCDGKHASHKCYQGKKMSLEDKRNIVKQKKACFSCLKLGHMASSNKCSNLKISCEVCSKRHYVMMCPELIAHKTENKRFASEISVIPETKENTLANQTCSSEVALKTLKAKITGNGKEKIIRIVVDDGSQRTYLSKKIIKYFQLKSVSQEKIIHSLFGGLESGEILHNRHEISVFALDRDYKCRISVLDQDKICGDIVPVGKGPWIDEFQKNNVKFTDIQGDATEVDMLIGADIAGKLMTGKICQLSNGLTAIETNLGWTLMGRIPLSKPKICHDTTLLVHSLFVQEADIHDLWSLDSLGITETTDRLSKEEHQHIAMKHFLETVKINEENRFEVTLPWIEGHPPLKSNKILAEKRLLSMSKKLSVTQRQAYQKVFNEWIEEGVIEEVPTEEVNDFGHYIAHRPVFNPSSLTTPVRPVFDASAKEKGSLSLNECLQKGPNLLELIPSILSRFRMNKYGVISDIRRAFLQISIRPEDRNFVRFLWWEGEDLTKIKIFRHRRVVFGLTSSPFLLAAVINYLLDTAQEKYVDTAKKLKTSCYVDNCVISLENKVSVEKFKEEAVSLMLGGQLDLRGWISNACEQDLEKKVGLLGLTWDLKTDTLQCDFSNMFDEKEIFGTKRSILSAAHRIYDPIGFTSPISLYPKILLQEIWKINSSWDEKLPEEIYSKFNSWIKQFSKVKEVAIPRWFGGQESDKENWSLHVFGDASKVAYAECVFLRIESTTKLEVHLVQAKSRVAPKKSVTIPRLELLSCLISCRLAAVVKKDMNLENIPCYYWTDSMNALYWIKNDESWGTYVWNRVKEIRELSPLEFWNHVPGSENPADLPSRGCSVKQLVDSHWWEGPGWLKLSKKDMATVG